MKNTMYTVKCLEQLISLSQKNGTWSCKMKIKSRFDLKILKSKSKGREPVSNKETNGLPNLPGKPSRAWFVYWLQWKSVTYIAYSDACDTMEVADGLVLIWRQGICYHNDDVGQSVRLQPTQVKPYRITIFDKLSLRWPRADLEGGAPGAPPPKIFQNTIFYYNIV